MKKATAIFFLVIFMLGNTAFGQLLKLPRLLVHFKTHQQHTPGINFLQFVYMHYLGDDGTAADDNEDNQLPFKQVYDHSTASQFSNTPEDRITVPPNACYILKTPCMGCYSNQYSYLCTSVCYRPPCTGVFA